MRIVNTPSRGIGAKLVEKIQHLAKKRNLSLFSACAYYARSAYVIIHVCVCIIYVQSVFSWISNIIAWIH